nr:hypothetical protein [Tanacetum cinerariifolium]
MVKLAFYDYHNMVAILEKTEHNTDFHQIVDILKASHIRYALTISHAVYVSHIRQFWSTARIETTNQETKILAIVDATNRVYNFSKIIFDGMVRNINSKGTKILMYPSPSFSGRTVPLFAAMIITQGEGSANPTESHHTPSPQKQHSPQHNSLPPSHPTITSEPLPQAPTETLTPRRYTRRAIRIAQSKPLSPNIDEPASLSRDDRQGEAFPTVSSLDPGQDRENIAKTSSLPHELSPRVTSLDADEGREIMEIGEELGADKSTELGSNDIKEMVNVLTSMDAANILTSGGATTSVSLGDVLPAAGVPTVSRSFPTFCAIFTTASVLARDSEIARLYAEEELKIMIEGLDKSNEVVAKHLREYEQAAADLSVGEKLELISELVKYQYHRAKILKYQAYQSKPLSKKEQREFYMSVLRSHAG